MAKDDYDTIVFKVLVYLYAVMKRKVVFAESAFYHAIGYEHIEDGYFVDVLRLMESENLIKSISVIKAWGNEYILSSDLCDMEITASGIHYLKENRKMRQIKGILVENVDTIASIITKTL